MTISEEIRMLSARLNISIAEIARRMGQSPQNLSSKLKRESFTVADLEKIAEVTGTTFERCFVLDNGEKI